MLSVGRYYIGDASVVLTPEEVKHLEQFKNGYCSLPDGTTIWKHAIENGMYRTSLGNILSVSIGVLAVIPLKEEYSAKAYVVNINKYGMTYSCFDKGVNVSSNNGDIQINDITIDVNNDGYFGGEVNQQNTDNADKVSQI